MNRRVRHLIAPVAILAVLACAPAALGSPSAVIRTCLQEGSLDGFSDADKRAALNQLAADQDEYSDCRSVIGASIGGKKAAIASASSSSRGTPEKVDAKQARSVRRKNAARKAKQVREARRKRARKVRERALGARVADPRDAGVFKAANTANGMPLPVTFAVIGLGLLTLTGGLLTLRRRNPRFAGALRRVTPPRFRR